MFRVEDFSAGDLNWADFSIVHRRSGVDIHWNVIEEISILEENLNFNNEIDVNLGLNLLDSKSWTKKIFLNKYLPIPETESNVRYCEQVGNVRDKEQSL